MFESLQQRETRLPDVAGRDGQLAVAVHQGQNVAAWHDALAAAPLSIDQEHCERRGYKNAAWLATNARCLTALRAGLPAPASPYAPLWTHYFATAGQGWRRVALKAISARPALVVDLEIWARPHPEAGIAPLPGAALMLLEDSLIQAIEQHGQPGFQLLYDLRPPHDHHDRPFDGPSLGAAAATAIHLACRGAVGNPHHAVIAAIHPSAPGLLQPVGLEVEKLQIAAAHPHLTSVTLAASHHLGELLPLCRRDYPSLQIHTASRIEDAMQQAVHYFLPHGACPPDDPFYQSDSWDTRAHAALRSPQQRAISLISPGQGGKSSLFNRLVAESRQLGWQVFVADLALYRSKFSAVDIFAAMLRRFRLDAGESAPPGESAEDSGETRYLRFLEAKLPHGPVLIAYEHAEQLKDTPAGHDFFAILRNVYELANHRPALRNVRQLFAVGANPQRIARGDVDSPFNVGVRLEIPWSRWSGDKAHHSHQLNQLYGSPLQTPAELDELAAYVGGNPFLVRACLYSLAVLPQRPPGLSLRAIWYAAPEIQQHLRALDRALRQTPVLNQAFRDLRSGKTITLRLADDLAQLGLVAAPSHGQTAQDIRVNCELYREYFRDRA